MDYPLDILGQQGQVLPGLTEEIRKSDISERIHAAVMIIGSAILLFGPCELIGVVALCSKGVRNHFKRNWRILMGETVQSVRRVVMEIPVPQPVFVPLHVHVPVPVLAPTSEPEKSVDHDPLPSSAPSGYKGPRLGRDLQQEIEGLQMEIEGLKAYNDNLWKTAQTVPDLRNAIAESDRQVQLLKKAQDTIVGERDEDREKLKKALLEMSQLKEMNGKLDQSLTTQKMEHEKELSYLVRDQARKIRKAVNKQTTRVEEVEREMTILAQRVVVAEETATQYSALPTAIDKLKETNKKLRDQLEVRDAQLQESQERARALEGELTTTQGFLETLMQHKAIGKTVRELVQAEVGSDE